MMHQCERTSVKCLPKHRKVLGVLLLFKTGSLQPWLEFPLYISVSGMQNGIFALLLIHPLNVLYGDRLVFILLGEEPIRQQKSLKYIQQEDAFFSSLCFFSLPFFFL